MPVPYRQIAFGQSAAENEAKDNGALLVQGYLDLHGAYETCLSSPHFIVLGHKGAGKSALGQHLRLSAAKTGVVARVEKLVKLPFGDFPRVATGADSWQLGFPAIWSFHLLLQIVDSFRTSKIAPMGEEFGRVIRSLEAIGRLPAEDLPTAIRHFGGVADAIADVFGVGFGYRASGLQDIVDRLTLLIQGHNSRLRHILVVDGLDEVLAPGVDEFRVLASLIASANELNNALSRSPTPAKVIILCRTDLFDRLPGANTAKYREDRAVELNWYQNTQAPAKSHLVSLLNQKARVTDSAIVDVVKDYFPGRISNRGMLPYLLDHTRHTPRDFLRVFSHIQQFEEPAARHVSHPAIRQGLRTYSAYFGREIKNELSGYATEAEIDSIFALLRRLNKSAFRLQEVEALAAREPQPLVLEPLLRRLFDCSAIGTVEQVAGGPRYSFKYRNPGATWNPDAEMRIHMGWRRDLSLPVDPKEQFSVEPRSRDTSRTRRRTPEDKESPGHVTAETGGAGLPRSRAQNRPADSSGRTAQSRTRKRRRSGRPQGSPPGSDEGPIKGR